MEKLQRDEAHKNVPVLSVPVGPQIALHHPDVPA